MSETSLLVKKQLIPREDPDFIMMRNFIRKHKAETTKLFDKFGWEVKLTSDYIYLKKGSVKSKQYFGIREFKDKTDYYLFVITLSFIADHGNSKIFIFEDLVEYIKAIKIRENIDIPLNSRKTMYSLYRVMFYIESKGYIIRIDGDVGDIIKGNIETVGLLYKITGLYKSFHNSLDNNQKELNMQQSLYLKLFASPVLNINKKEHDILYQIKDEIENDFKEIFDEDVSLILNEDYAYINHNEGNYFPNEKNRKDWLLLRTNCELRKYSGQYISIDHLNKILDNIRISDSMSWTKEMVLWGDRQYKNYVLTQMQRWKFIIKTDDKLYINPVIRDIYCKKGND